MKMIKNLIFLFNKFVIKNFYEKLNVKSLSFFPNMENFNFSKSKVISEMWGYSCILKIFKKFITNLKNL